MACTSNPALSACLACSVPHYNRMSQCLLHPLLVDQQSLWILMPACCDAGVVPMLAAPGAGNNDTMLQEAVTAAGKRGLVRPHDHVVCVMSIKDSLVVKVVTMDSIGARCMRHTDSAQGEHLDSCKCGCKCMYALRLGRCSMC